MLIEEFHEIELPVEENGKWVIYAVGSKSIRLLSNGELHKDMTCSHISHDGGLTSVTITCEYDTEFDATANGLTYLLNSMFKDSMAEAGKPLAEQLEDAKNESTVMDFK